MAKTSAGRLKGALEQMLLELEIFEEFRSPVNFAAVKVMFENKPEGADVRVAVREDGGVFYRGTVSHVRATSFSVLADDGELVFGVTADMFVSAMLVEKPV